MKKTVFITGASSGFGTHVARAFAHGGYGLVLHGRDEKKLYAVRDEIAATEKVECLCVFADLRTAEGINAITTAIHANAVDILVNNAAVNPELSGNAAHDVPAIEEIMSVNASSAIVLCYAAFADFTTRGGGTIININSVAGLRGSSHEALYAVSKFALRGFSESVKEDWLKQGVKMIDVYPGALGTGMSAHRADVQSLIDPREFAEYLVTLCATKSFFVKELNIRRTAV